MGLYRMNFLDWCIGELEEIGETEDLVLSNFNEKGQAVHGYTYSDHDNRLDLFLTHYENTNQEYTLYKSDCDTFIQRLKTFIKKPWMVKILVKIKSLVLMV